MFAKALPMIQTVGALKRLELLRNSSELKDKLWVNVNALQNGLRERNFNIGDTNTCVTHTLEDVNETLTAFEAIREKLVNGTYKEIADRTTVNMDA